jgi:hypothetical protein
VEPKPFNQNAFMIGKITLEYKGKTQNLQDWAKESGITYTILHRRHQLGWSAERIFETKARTKKKVDFERELDEMSFDQLPKEIKETIKTFGYEGVRYGNFINRHHRKVFQEVYERETQVA